MPAKGRAIQRNVPAWAWHMWAMNESGGWPRLGYPTRQPFYQPARLSKVEVLEDEAPRPPPPNEAEMAVVERLTEVIGLYRQRRPNEVRCLVVYEGAYPAADPTLEARCWLHRMSVSTCRRMASRAKREIDILVGA